MFNMIVVDDEYYAVKGITQGIDWSDLPVDRIFEAFDVETAKMLLGSERIDLLITDIEMPNVSGLDLLEWVKAGGLHVKTVILTGHADFAYAQQALRLGSQEYILKPIDPDQVKGKIGELIELLKQERELIRTRESYKSYYELWQTQRLQLTERFWLDLVEGRICPLADDLTAQLQLHDIPLTSESRVVPVAIRIEQWKKPLNTRDLEIMNFALRNAAEELFRIGAAVQSFQLRSSLIILLVEDDGLIADFAARIKMTVERYVTVCDSYFYCAVTCYSGVNTELGGFAETCRSLMEQIGRSPAERSAGISAELHADDQIAVIRKIMHYVYENLHRDITREDIAAHVYLNSAYLSRLFKRETGQSLSEYILTAKLNRAKTLLTGSNVKVGAISEMVGFIHFPYFTKIFKKNVGVPPQQYRKKYQKSMDAYTEWGKSKCTES